MTAAGNGCASDTAWKPDRKLRASEFLILLVLFLWPWLLGGVLVWANPVLAILAFAAFGLAAMSVVRRPQMRFIPVVSWLLLAAMILGAIQLVPIPDRWLSVVSPVAARTRASAAESWNIPKARAPVSLSPADTRREIAQLWIAAAFCTSGGLVFSRRNAARRMMLLLTWNGVLLTLFGAIQRAHWNGCIYWLIKSPSMNSFGPFVNHNNAGGYLLLCFVAALSAAGARMYALASPAAVVALTGTSQGGRNWHDRWGWLQVQARQLLGDASFVGYLVASIMIATGILLTLSRGAFLGLLGAMFVAGAFMAWRGYRGFVGILGTLAASAIGLLCCVGRLPQVQSRLATLIDSGQMVSDRVQHLCEALVMVPDFWVTGCGLGAYRRINEMYRLAAYEGWYLYVENQWVETILVGGVLGIGIASTVIYLMVKKIWRLHSSVDDSTWGLGLLGGGVLASQLIAGTFDFGWYIPANMVTFAAIIGILGATRTAATGPVAFRFFVGVMIVSGIWTIGESVAIARCQEAVNQFRSLSFHDNAEPLSQRGALENARTKLQNAVRLRPDDIDALTSCADAWIQQARLRAWEQMELEIGSNVPSLWRSTSLLRMSWAVHRGTFDDDPSTLYWFVKKPFLRRPLTQAAALYRIVCLSAPTVATARFKAALLAPWATDPLVDAAKLAEEAVALAPQRHSYHRKLLMVRLAASREDRLWDAAEIGSVESR